MNPLRRLVHALGRRYVRELCRRESLRRESPRVSERPIEYTFALDCLARLDVDSVLDVGSGYSPWPALLHYCGYLVKAVDLPETFWAGELHNRHFYVIRDDITHPKLTGQFDAVTCLSVLEHIPDYDAALRGMFRLLRPGGYLILSFPYSETQFIDNVYELEGSNFAGHDPGFICHCFSRRELDGWLRLGPAEVVEQNWLEAFEGPVWQVGPRLRPARRTGPDQKHHLTCLLLRKSDEVPA